MINMKMNQISGYFDKMKLSPIHKLSNFMLLKLGSKYNQKVRFVEPKSTLPLGGVANT